MNVGFTNTFFNVKNFGAKGDGVTDDTLAISNALNAIPSYGGTLYFPYGIYTNQGGLFITKPVTILGDGQGSFATVASTSIYYGATTIVYNSTTNFMFCFTNITAGSVRNLSLINSATTPLTNAAIVTCVSTNIGQKIDFDSVVFCGGYRGLEQHAGVGWCVHNCMFINQTWESFLIDNVVAPDAGDWAISDTSFIENPIHANAALQIFGSGGAKITNCKFLGPYTNDIAIRLTHGGTSNFQLSNCSIEGAMWWSLNFWGTSTWVSFTIVGCQFHAGNAQTNPQGPGGCIAFNAGVGNDSIITGNVLLGCSATNPILLNNVTNVIVGNNISDSPYPTVGVNVGSQNIYTNNALVKIQ